MKFKISFIALILVSTFVNAQKNEARGEVKDAYEYAKKSYRKANSALSELNHADYVMLLTEVRSNAKKAKDDVDDAMQYIKKAGDRTKGLDKNANIRRCKAGEGIGSSASFFQKAQAEYDQALSKLRTSSYESNLNMLKDNLKSAKDHLQEGSDHLKKGLDGLDETLEKLEDCK